MTFVELLWSGLTTIRLILAVLAVVALIETAIPLHARGRWGRLHLVPNLALTLLTFATNAVFNAALVLALMTLHRAGLGLLPTIGAPPALEMGIVVLGLDFSFYVGHVAMHKTPGFWRFHRVHHSDPAVDVTTTIRQHPGEGVIRYAFMAAAAILLGASPGAFAVYRAWSALHGLLEHANIRVPRRLDRLVSLVFSTPNMHKVHHSRDAAETDTNYGNILAVFDRLFSTFTPSERGLKIAYGLDDVVDPAAQTTAALLALPFRKNKTRPGPVLDVRTMESR
jgi:sterol desaturase/sphingolipid hydroxylase (fatty acid hydroxylase superfamily)